jgi:hypothetical protein
MLINKKNTRDFALYAAKGRAHKFSRVSADYYLRAESALKEWIRKDLNTLPSVGKTIKTLLLAAVITGIPGMLMAAGIPGISTDPGIVKIRVVNAILGEAEGESYDGKLAIACAIRNRGTLKGVYGENAPRVKQRKYSSKALVDAIRAYEESQHEESCAFIRGATGWGNKNDIRMFRRTKWWKNCKIVKQIGGHWFYSEIK